MNGVYVYGLECVKVRIQKGGNERGIIDRLIIANDTNLNERNMCVFDGGIST